MHGFVLFLNSYLMNVMLQQQFRLFSLQFLSQKNNYKVWENNNWQFHLRDDAGHEVLNFNRSSEKC